MCTKIHAKGITAMERQGIFVNYDMMASGGEKLFTVTLSPAETGVFPTVLVRNPYTNNTISMTIEETLDQTIEMLRFFVDAGYAVVYQHCRGYGKSTGFGTPFIHEQEDGRNMLNYARQQPFYNGELYLWGGSYLCFVHFAIAPYPEDIKGAALSVMTTERYELHYRNGCIKSGQLAGWYTGMYKQRELSGKKCYTPDVYRMLPLRDLPLTAFGEHDPYLEEVMRNPRPEDPFWSTAAGGGDMRHAMQNVPFPVLMTGGFNDFAGGGMIRMWREMTPETRAHFAMVMSPNDHTDSHPENSLDFPDSTTAGHFGPNLWVRWFDSLRGKGDCPVEMGHVSYYTKFENKWSSDDFTPGTHPLTLPMGESARTYLYNPFDAIGFKGGMSQNFDGAEYQDPANWRFDLVSTYTAPFVEDTYVKGEITAELTVSSDCPDTCFFMRISITTENGDYPLRDDIRTLVYELGDYTPGEKVTLHLHFDEDVFMIPAGAKLRFDVSSADKAHYICHTNYRGPFREQDRARVAHNTVYLDESTVTLPIV